MLFHVLYPLREWFFAFNVFKYITFRAAGAGITAFLFCALCGPAIIGLLRRLNVGEKVRGEAEVGALHQLHKNKNGTPTMGGVLIVAALLLSTVLWADLSNTHIWLALLSTLWLGGIGFVDDYIKLRREHARGLTAKIKLYGQLACGLVVGGILLFNGGAGVDRLDIPFLKSVGVYLGVGYVLFVALVIIGTSNAVNLTDGLDGLAVGCSSIVALTYAGFSYLSGHAGFSEYLQIVHMPLAGELTVFCAAIFGAGLGFLWFNCHPAEVFMGDTGSLALGGAIGAVAVLIKKELLLILVGGIFVAEAVSVMMQVISFRLWKRRVFRCAPLHHHFQLSGWPESKITFRFLIIAIMLAMFSLSTLKLR